MRQVMRIVFMLLLGLMFIPTVLANGEPEIRVGLWTNQANIIVSCESNFKIIDSNSQAILGAYKAHDKVGISAKQHVLSINNTQVASVNLEIVPVDKDTCIEVNRRIYKGSITIHPTINKQGLTVINTLPMEQYLYGVVPQEMSPEWSIEAVKAQAVAARTFAYYQKYRTLHTDGFDVTAGTSSQVYGGWNTLAKKAMKAVDSTRGMVMTYQGKVIPAYFCSSAGGYTENSENVWGSNLPFLRGVPDFDQHSPDYKWEKKFTAEEITLALNRAGYSMDKLEAIELSRLSSPPVEAEDRGVSGRIKKIRFIGHNNSVELTGEKVRNVLSLKSTLFDMDIIVPAPKNIPLEMTGSFGDTHYKNVPVSLPDYKLKPLITDKDNIRRITGSTNEIVKITGFGWGHGLGMSQWGAKAMAEQAPANSSEYFKTILKHYYRGVQVKQIY